MDTSTEESSTGPLIEPVAPPEKELSREVPMPLSDYDKGETGFFLNDLHHELESFISTDYSSGKSIPLGWFIIFVGENRGTERIGSIKINKIKLTMGNGVNVGDNWLATLAQHGGVVDLEPLSLTAQPVIIKHEDGGVTADRDSIANGEPELKISDPQGTSLVKDLRGYSNSLKVAYLDHTTLWQMALAVRRQPNRENLRYLFTGAEVNHGEMASPSFQHDRFKVWKNSNWEHDPSICPTLKVEAVYKGPGDSNRYFSGDINGMFTLGNDDFMLPGTFLLASCERYWQIVGKIMAQCSGSLNTKLDEKQTEGVNNLLNVVKVETLKALVEKGTKIPVLC